MKFCVVFCDSAYILWEEKVWEGRWEWASVCVLCELVSLFVYVYFWIVVPDYIYYCLLVLHINSWACGPSVYTTVLNSCWV